MLSVQFAKSNIMVLSASGGLEGVPETTVSRIRFVDLNQLVIGKACPDRDSLNNSIFISNPNVKTP